MQILNNVKRIGIIGSGVAGLAAARLLSAAGFQCEIFEQGEKVGGVWTVGYHGFGLQTPYSLYEIPDFPMPKSFPRLPSGEQLQAYFESYAKHFGFFDNIKFNSSIEQIEPTDDNRWLVKYRNQKTTEKDQQTFDFVVVASGLYSHPFVPEIPGRDKFHGKLLHSSEYLQPQQFEGHKTVIVGFGKSALDIATDATARATSVTLLFRKAHWPIPVDILNLIDVRRIFFNRLVLGFMPLYQRPSPYARSLHKYFPWLVRGFWRFLEWLLCLQFPLKVTGTRPDESPENDFFSHDFLPRKQTYKLLKQGKIKAIRGAIREFDEQGIVLDDGQKIPCDNVIFGTGWQQDFSFLPQEFKDSVEADGVYLYRHILHPDLSNLAFIGWASTFSNSLTSHLTSVWLVNALNGKIEVPDPKAMQQEIEGMKQWKRSFIPDSSSRSALLQLHMWNFHDELMRDIGINPRRKPNWFTEWLQDYRPTDYKAILQNIGSSID